MNFENANLICIFSFSGEKLIQRIHKFLLGMFSGDRPGFHERLFFQMAATDCDNKLVVGDFNVALYPNFDTLNYSEIRCPNAREKILDKMGEGGFIDIFRQKFPDKINFLLEMYR